MGLFDTLMNNASNGLNNILGNVTNPVDDVINPPVKIEGAVDVDLKQIHDDLDDLTKQLKRIGDGIQNLAATDKNDFIKNVAAQIYANSNFEIDATGNAVNTTTLAKKCVERAKTLWKVLN